MKDLKIQLYKTMYLIRRAEVKIQEHYAEDEMKTPMHMSMGAEAISAGVCQALETSDQILGTYRSHGIYIAKTGETDNFFAEMYGRVTGTSKGKGGSMHLLAPKSGLIATSAVVSSHIPVAIGAAFANKQVGNKRMVAVFFGDGATDEGVFWESLNAACLMKLPIVFVCEDNDLAIHTPSFLRHGYKKITDIIQQFDCNVYSSESTDAEEIYNLATQAIGVTRETFRPAFLHLKYYRYLEHVGVFEDFQAGYRSRKEFEAWLDVDPLKVMRSKLLELIPAEQVINLEQDIIDKVERSDELARKAPFPELEELCRSVYA